VIELNVLNQEYYLRTREILWYREMKKAISLILDEKKTAEDIRELSNKENIFNASSASRARDMQRTIIRRIAAVNQEYLVFFLKQTVEVQEQMSIIMVMLTDHAFLDFMNLVYREKLIKGDLILHDGDIMGFFHGLQEKNERTAKWTDASIKKVRDNYKSMLKEAGMLSDAGANRKIIKPIINKEMKDFLDVQGLDRIYRILAGERE
jgi:hypothetical protein